MKKKKKSKILVRAGLRCLRLHPAASPFPFIHRQPHSFPCLADFYTLPARSAR